MEKEVLKCFGVLGKKFTSLNSALSVVSLSDSASVALRWQLSVVEQWRCAGSLV